MPEVVFLSVDLLGAILGGLHFSLPENWYTSVERKVRTLVSGRPLELAVYLPLVLVSVATIVRTVLAWHQRHSPGEELLLGTVLTGILLILISLVVAVALFRMFTKGMR